MYARLINILFRPEALPEVTEHFRAQSAPLIASHAGNAGILATTNAETGRIYLLTLWDSEANREASAVHPAFLHEMANFGQWMARGFNRESFDVLAESLSEFVTDDPHRIASTRLTFITTSPVGWDESVAAYSRLVR